MVSINGEHHTFPRFSLFELVPFVFRGSRSLNLALPLLVGCSITSSAA